MLIEIKVAEASNGGGLAQLNLNQKSVFLHANISVVARQLAKSNERNREKSGISDNAKVVTTYLNNRIRSIKW